jgi:hypothetical protein
MVAMTSQAHELNTSLSAPGYKLGWSLAEVLFFDYLNPIARGGFDQWVMARQEEAWRDYEALRDDPSRPNLGVMRRRWAKHLAFVRAHQDQMELSKGEEFADMLLGVIGSIVYNIDHMEAGDDFDPRCRRCWWDMIVVSFDDPELPCVRVV